MPTTKRWIAIAEVTLAVLFWGASFIATKIALRDIAPVTVVWLRFAMGVLILGIAVFWRGQFALPQGRDWGYFALLGFLGITFHQWLQSTGLVTAQASTTAWIVAATPIFMALLGWLFLHEKLSLIEVSGIGLAALGVIIVITQGRFSSLLAGRFGTPGDKLILISSLNWAVFSALSRQGLQRHPATRMMFFVMTFGWLFTSALFLSGTGWQDISRLSLAGWSGVAFLGIFCSGLAYIFWYDALQSLPTAQVGAFLYIEPLVALIVAAILLNEAILFASLLGGAMILCGVWLVNRQRNLSKNRPLPKLEEIP